jgi:hypothetical protein
MDEKLATMGAWAAVVEGIYNQGRKNVYCTRRSATRHGKCALVLPCLSEGTRRKNIPSLHGLCWYIIQTVVHASNPPKICPDASNEAL